MRNLVEELLLGAKRLEGNQAPPAYRDPEMDRRWNGAFMVPSCMLGGWLRILISTGYGWEHASVSLYDRCPYWVEMEQVKRIFWRPEETVMQLHVPPEDHINFHPYCLHLWRPTHQVIPRPPYWMVGPGGKSPEQIAADVATLDPETGEPRG